MFIQDSLINIFRKLSVIYSLFIISHKISFNTIISDNNYRNIFNDNKNTEIDNNVYKSLGKGSNFRNKLDPNYKLVNTKDTLCIYIYISSKKGFIGRKFLTKCTG